MSNPIADCFDRTVDNTLTDERRPIKGFTEMLQPSGQYHRVHALCQSLCVDGSTSQRNLSDVIHHVMVIGMWVGFEAGKSYVMSGDMERMLALEDQWNKQNEGQSQSSTTS